MNILPFERSTSFWHRTAFLADRMQQLVEWAPDDVHSATVLGEAFQQLYAMRARSRLTQYRLAETGTLGAETSVDQILVATAEQQVFDAARELLPGLVELDDSVDGERWRHDYVYSRAATIYGGSAEIQRNIVARRLLDLGPET
jgi:alkylation response protein AidB-like acyl-CoA dehydrogenase